MIRGVEGKELPQMQDFRSDLVRFISLKSVKCVRCLPFLSFENKKVVQSKQATIGKDPKDIIKHNMTWMEAHSSRFNVREKATYILNPKYQYTGYGH